MSIICGLPLLECVYCLACTRWVSKKCLYNGSHESENWGLATAEEFEPVPRLCRLIMAIYEDDLENPLWAPPEGYRIKPDWVFSKKNYTETMGNVTPYIIYRDQDNSEIVLAIRGLNLARGGDYAVLLDDKLGQTKFDCGYVHSGLLKAAIWVFDKECDVLRGLIEKNPDYRLIFAGHSLGAGVAAMLAMYAIKEQGRLGNIERRNIRCFAMAPTRCMSLNLAVRYSDVINSVVLQDDFLPRTTVAMENLFKSVCCLPCLLCLMCLKDTCTLEEKLLKDPRRLYAPGRLYHIVERKPFRIGRYPPVVRTAVPVDGRFEQIVLSCNATNDHAILWVHRECEEALKLMMEKDPITEIPLEQRMERKETIAREHSEEYEAAVRRADALNISQSHPISYGTFFHSEGGESSGSSSGLKSMLSFKNMREHWDSFVDRLFDVDEFGRVAIKKSLS